MPTRIGYGLMTIIGFVFIFGTAGIVSSIENASGISPVFGLIVLAPISGYIFYHIRKWIAHKAHIQDNTSPIGMTLTFTGLILVLYFLAIND